MHSFPFSSRKCIYILATQCSGRSGRWIGSSSNFGGDKSSSPSNNARAANHTTAFSLSHRWSPLSKRLQKQSDVCECCILFPPNCILQICFSFIVTVPEWMFNKTIPVSLGSTNTSDHSAKSSSKGILSPTQNVLHR